MFLIDIAIPRDIEPEVNTLDHVYLYDIDDLHQVVSANIKEREREAGRAEELVEQETISFLLWMETLEVVPTIVSLRERAEACRQREMARVRARLGPLTPEEEEALETLTTAIVNKLLHAPIAQLKRHAGSSDAYDYLRVARDLFDLDG
jgi:glutamyl-tRNA reductase